MDSTAKLIPLRLGVPPGAALGQREDDELMLLVRGGRADAFDELVRRHQARVLSYAQKILVDPDLARDAAQRAFIELYQYVPRYQARGMFSAFLYRLVLNQCRMLQRADRRRARQLDAFLEEPRCDPPSPDDQILERERRRDVERALASVGERHRDVLTLRFSAGLSTEEVSQVLGIPVGTVKSRLFHGLARMRGLLAKEVP